MSQLRDITLPSNTQYKSRKPSDAVADQTGAIEKPVSGKVGEKETGVGKAAAAAAAAASIPESSHDVLVALTESATLSSASESGNNTRNMLIYYGKEMLCLLAILLTTLASYQGTPTVGRPPKPRHFFPIGSTVRDYPGGSLETISAQIGSTELSFVLFYAPWCSTSQSARQPYEDVAQFYYREAHFSAINCWQPGSECRAQYTKIKSWPVLMAYLPGLGVLYNGPWQRDPMMRFVNSFLHPLKRLHDPDELLQEMTGRDATVVAFLDLQTNIKHWNIFFDSAIKWLFKDPFQEVRFCVVTGTSYKKFGVETPDPILRLYLWNEMLEYENATWAGQDIENWVTRHMHKVAVWMTPLGSKSNNLAYYLNAGPALMFFTPRNLLRESSDAMEMVRQLGMEYFNCGQDEWIREMVHEYVPGQRLDHHEQYKQLTTYCKGFMTTATMNRLRYGHHKSVSLSFVNLINSSSSLTTGSANLGADICEIESRSVFAKGHHSSKYTDAVIDEESCPANVKCSTLDIPLRATSIVDTVSDRRSSNSLRAMAKTRRCETMAIDRENSVTSFLGTHPFDRKHLHGIEGLACKAGNRTLSLILLDSTIYHPFAERLGVNVLNARQKSAAVIVDPQLESTYILNERQDINLETLSRFVRKYSEGGASAGGTLRRTLRSFNDDNEHTHFYRAQPRDNVKTVSIEEVNSNNFTRIVLNSNKDRNLLIFFYTSNCAFCSMMAQNLLQISNILRDLQPQYLRIVRIDGEKNDLPWPYTMAEYPSLIMLPSVGTDTRSRGGLQESRLFSITGRNSVTLDNLLGFVIANLDRPLRIYAIEETCAMSRKSVKSLRNCLNTLRNEILDGIAFSLGEWRRRASLDKARAGVLKRLQILEAFYLETFRINDAFQCYSCDFNKLESYSRRIVKFWNTL